ncbi:uncharacterized protein ISCGN_003280 [Ixodes scapularis]
MASASSAPSSSSASAATKPPVAIAEDRTYPHPDNITSWSEDMRLWPSVTSPDVIYYLVNTKACDLQDVKAYRNLESYNYLQSGWVGKLSVHQIDAELCYVKGQVTPSQSVNQTTHTAWACARDSGEVLTAGCTCMAGQARVCSHVGAILWKVDLAVTRGLTGFACTDIAAKWNQGTKCNVVPARLSDITFNLQKRTLDPAPGKLPLRPLLMPMGEEELAALHRDSPFRDLFNIPGTLLYDTFHAPEREDATVAANDAATPCHGSHLATDDLPSSCEPCSRFYAEHVVVTSTAAAALEEATRSQQTPTWFVARRLRLTASNVYKVPKKSTTSCEKSATSMVCPTFTGNAATRHGQLHEPVARAQLVRDYGMTVTRCGMFVSKDFPWLSATPDGMVGQALLEIKCPNTNDCKQLAKGGTYDVRHSEKDGYFITQNGPRGFYSQVQFQLFCTGRQVFFLCVEPQCGHPNEDSI